MRRIELRNVGRIPRLKAFSFRLWHLHVANWIVLHYARVNGVGKEIAHDLQIGDRGERCVGPAVATGCYRGSIDFRKDHFTAGLANCFQHIGPGALR
ncbi:hypothetical protein [Rhizobium leguminosarum]|uniref:hypothetical protein n=1 Tax=Rhizobium leguminosarum TaxID=384 RepID=UPI001FD9E132|nr:hypothetical protein [Rhizobium leguminosarum]